MEVAIAMKAIAKAKVVEPDGIPVELLKLQLQQDWAILLELHRLATLIWREGKVSQQLLLLLFLTFSVLGANPKKLLYTVANPARGLLNREKRTKEKVW